MSTQVHIEYSEKAAYSEWHDTEMYGPDTVYPEFQSVGLTAGKKENPVYEMVRNTLISLGLDKKNVGTENWNPMGDLIRENDTVLLKPNMVCHANGSIANGTDCLVTHPSVVRAVLDYVVLALGKTGHIILADAPVQSCDFEQLITVLHYDKLVDYYKQRGYRIELMDLRQLDAVYMAKNSEKWTSKNEDIVVNLDGESSFCSEGHENHVPEKLRITNYLPEHMAEFHSEKVHKYSVAKAVLQADVIINLPKPKSHRKAGITASLKNMVGCVAKKECLPHHTIGSKCEQGDEYLGKSFWKRLRTKIAEKNDRRVAAGKRKSLFLLWIDICFAKMTKLSKQDTFSEGSWYGNDTLWRTICDICRVVMYADKQGKLQPTAQRRQLILADMIVAGEGDGPLNPSPRNEGIIVGGFEQTGVDYVIAALMGYSGESFPTLKNADYGDAYKLSRSEVAITSNWQKFNQKTLEEIQSGRCPFQLTEGWQKVQRSHHE